MLSLKPMKSNYKELVMLEPITAVSVMLGKELLKKFVNTSVDLSVEKIKAEAKKEGKDITDEQAKQVLNYVKEQKNTQIQGDYVQGDQVAGDKLTDNARKIVTTTYVENQHIHEAEKPKKS